MAGIVFSKSLKLCFASEGQKYMDENISVDKLKQHGRTCLKNGSQKQEHSNILRLIDSHDYTHVVTGNSKYEDMDSYEKAGYQVLNTRRYPSSSSLKKKQTPSIPQHLQFHAE